jgi:hypothetical protein
MCQVLINYKFQCFNVYYYAQSVMIRTVLRVNSHGSRVPLVLANPNMEVESRLLSIMNLVKYGSCSLVKS